MHSNTAAPQLSANPRLAMSARKPITTGRPASASAAQSATQRARTHAGRRGRTARWSASRARLKRVGHGTPPAHDLSSGDAHGLAELRKRPVRANLGRSFADAQHGPDFLEAHAQHVVKDERVAPPFREPGKRLLDRLPIPQALNLGRHGNVRQGLIGDRLVAGSTIGGASVHQEYVARDGVDPWFDGPRRLVSLAHLVELQERLLQEVLGNRGVPREGPQVARESAPKGSVERLERLHVAALVGRHRLQEPLAPDAGCSHLLSLCRWFAHGYRRPIRRSISGCGRLSTIGRPWGQRCGSCTSASSASRCSASARERGRFFLIAAWQAREAAARSRRLSPGVSRPARSESSRRTISAARAAGSGAGTPRTRTVVPEAGSSSRPRLSSSLAASPASTARAGGSSAISGRSSRCTGVGEPGSEQPLEQHPLVRHVLVDEHQPLGVLQHEVGVPVLADVATPAGEQRAGPARRSAARGAPRARRASRRPGGRRWVGAERERPTAGMRRRQHDHPPHLDRTVERHAGRGQRLGEDGGHPSRVGKADLGLRGVHVHVHVRRREPRGGGKRRPRSRPRDRATRG